MEVAGKRLDDDTVSELCEPCQEGNMSTQADGYCNDCEEYMCQTCFQSHVKMKVLRNHVLGALDGGPRKVSQKSETKCKKHTTEVIKYYCRYHDSVGCGHCLVFDHRKCEPEVIEDLAKNLKESSDYKDILKGVEELESLKAEIEVSLEKNRNYNTEMHDRAIQGIQNQRAEINTWLDNITTKMEAEEMEIWKENETVLYKLEDWIKIINDMIDKVRDEMNAEKYSGDNLFIRMIECKSEVSAFAIKSVPEIKSNLDIKPFAFEPNQKLCVFTKSANLGIIRFGNGTAELQYQLERQSDATCADGASSLASSNLPEHETEVVCSGDMCTFKSPEDPLQVDLEKELKNIRQTTSEEKKENEILQQSYNTLKKEPEDQESLLSREREEREKYVLKIKELEQKIVFLKQEVSSLNDLNTSLKSQLDSRNKEFDVLESTYKTRQEQDNTKIKSLQSELKKIRFCVLSVSENHKQECERLSSQIQDLQRQKESAQETYQFPDPRAAGFHVGKRVKYISLGWSGTVTAVYLSGYVDVKWDNGRRASGYRAGAEGKYEVKLL